MGYAGGTTPDPTYRRIGDHAETLQVDYDPAAVSYEALVRLFWELHAPLRPPYSRQYRSALFFADAEQERVARAVKAELEAAQGRRLFTEMGPLEGFTRAEDYHQKWYLRHDAELMREFAAYPEREFEDSRVAARLNGYVVGDGDARQLAREVGSFGLSPGAAARVVARAGAASR